MKKNNLIKILTAYFISFSLSFLFLLSFHPSSILEKILCIFILMIGIVSLVNFGIEIVLRIGKEKEKGSERKMCRRKGQKRKMKDFLKNIEETSGTPLQQLLLSVFGIILAFFGIQIAPQIFVGLPSIFSGTIIVMSSIVGNGSGICLVFAIARFFFEKEEKEEKEQEEKGKENEIDI